MDYGWSDYIKDSFARLDSGETGAEFERMVAPHLAAAPRAILDVGTGPGHFLFEMARRFPAAALHGVDNHPDHLARARADLAARGVRCELELASGAALPYGDESFDLVICQAVMPYAPDDARFLAELMRVLAGGGVLWFATHGFGFYAIRVVRRAPKEKLRYLASALSGSLSMLFGWKPLPDTPVTVGWLRRAMRTTGLEVRAVEWSRYGFL